MPARMRSGTAHIAALAFDHNAGSILLVAILSGEPCELDLGGWPAGTASVMDIVSWMSHASGDRPSPWRPVQPLQGARLQLPAYAIAKLSAAKGLRRPEDWCWAEGCMSESPGLQ